MKFSWRHFPNMRDLGISFLVAVSVAAFSTLAGSVFDHVHKVDAEELSGITVDAKPVADAQQRLTLASWGVTLTLPLAAELPLVRYTTGSGSSVGLSSQDLEKIGSACSASHAGLGNLVRLPAGSFTAAVHGDPSMHFIATITDHDYVYKSPLNNCSSSAVTSAIVNREESAILNALDSLAPITTQ